MGFKTVSLLVTLTRDELIGLIFDNKSVETETQGNPITLSGSRTYDNVPNYRTGGVTHTFFTNIRYEGAHLSVKAELHSDDGKTFLGFLTGEQYPDNMSE